MIGVIEHFRIGQPVEVVPDYRYSEWHGVPLFVVGIRCIERNGFDVTYDVSERWPVQSNGDVTTEFSQDDLVERSSTGAAA